jgi:hypothetical protein
LSAVFRRVVLLLQSDAIASHDCFVQSRSCFKAIACDAVTNRVILERGKLAAAKLFSHASFGSPDQAA